MGRVRGRVRVSNRVKILDGRRMSDAGLMHASLIRVRVRVRVRYQTQDNVYLPHFLPNRIPFSHIPSHEG